MSGTGETTIRVTGLHPCPALGATTRRPPEPRLEAAHPDPIDYASGMASRWLHALSSSPSLLPVSLRESCEAPAVLAAAAVLFDRRRI